MKNRLLALVILLATIMAFTLPTVQAQDAPNDGRRGDKSFNAAARTAPLTAPRSGVPPANDNIANATVISTLPSLSVVTDFDLATNEVGEPLPSCLLDSGNNAPQSIWFRISLGTAATVNLDMRGSEFDGSLAVFSGTPGALTEIACDDDFSYESYYPAIVSLNLDAADYYVRVGAYSSPALNAGTMVVLKVNTTPEAQTLTPNTFTDVQDSNPGDGTCNDGTGLCSLRGAIMEANFSKPGSTITLQQGTYTLVRPNNPNFDPAFGENAAYDGDLDIIQNMSVFGAGIEQTIINGGGIDRVFDIWQNASATIQGLTITGGSLDSDFGGGIIVFDPSTILNLNTVLIRDNSAFSGGGLYIYQGTVVANNVTLMRNTAQNEGGGLLLANNAGFTGTNVTFSANTAASGGAAYVPRGTRLTTNHASYISNVATTAGGGLYIEAGLSGVTRGRARFGNSLFGRNVSPIGPHCAGPSSSLGYNVLGSDAGCTNLLATDKVNVTVNVDKNAAIHAPGTNFTHKLATDSPALNAANPLNCAPTDQRGVARPQGGACDVGAFELIAGLPAPFTQSLPTHGAEFANRNDLTGFSWTQSNGAYTYQIAINRESQNIHTAQVLASNACTGGTCTYAVDSALRALLSDGLYQWTVSVVTDVLPYPTSSNPAREFVMNELGTDLVTNGSFETFNANNKPSNWTYELPTGSAAVKRCNTDTKIWATDGVCAIRWNSAPNMWSRAYQIIDFTGDPNAPTIGDTLVMDFTAVKATAGSRVVVKIKVRYSDGTKMSAVSRPIPVGSNNRYLSKSLVLPGTVRSITVIMVNTSTTGYVVLDDLRVLLQRTSAAPLVPLGAPEASAGDGSILPLPEAPSN